MKLTKIVGIILVVFGVLVALASALTDVLGLGAAGFGLQQIAGIAFGAIDAVLGLVLLRNKKSG